MLVSWLDIGSSGSGSSGSRLGYKAAPAAGAVGLTADSMTVPGADTVPCGALERIHTSWWQASTWLRPQLSPCPGACLLLSFPGTTSSCPCCLCCPLVVQTPKAPALFTMTCPRAKATGTETPHRVVFPRVSSWNRPVCPLFRA